MIGEGEREEGEREGGRRGREGELMFNSLFPEPLYIPLYLKLENKKGGK
jgi:hypothetical protein